MSSYRLTSLLAAQHSGGVLCLDSRAEGRTFQLYADRPGPEINESSEVYTEAEPAEEVEQPETGVSIVRITGPLEQRAAPHGECGGWTDGHDAIADRLISALAEGDVLLVVDSPGGVPAGISEAVRRVQKAKAKYGRYITAYADEMICSAAYWWAACVSDEIYGPESMVVGSIGCRSAHVSEAEALKKAGVAFTYFAAPGPGKYALAPELPLSKIGKERAEREVWQIFEMFARDVSAARGMTREEIVELNADALPGQMAVDAKLVDGVASFDEVLALAIARAQR